MHAYNRLSYVKVRRAPKIRIRIHRSWDLVKENKTLLIFFFKNTEEGMFKEFKTLNL